MVTQAGSKTTTSANGESCRNSMNGGFGFHCEGSDSQPPGGHGEPRVWSKAARLGKEPVETTSKHATKKECACQPVWHYMCQPPEAFHGITCCQPTMAFRTLAMSQFKQVIKFDATLPLVAFHNQPLMAFPRVMSSSCLPWLLLWMAAGQSRIPSALLLSDIACRYMPHI